MRRAHVSDPRVLDPRWRCWTQCSPGRHGPRWSYIEVQASEHVSSAKKVWEEFVCSTVFTDNCDDADPRVCFAFRE